MQKTKLNELELINIQKVKPSMNIELCEVLPFYASFLKQNAVDTPVIVEENSCVILKGHEIYESLKLLSANKTPVLKVNIQNVEVIPLKANITKEAILKAGLEGPKLPSKSFMLKLDSPKINISLSKLLKSEEKSRLPLNVYNGSLELLYASWPTPLVKLNSLSNNQRSVWAKLEGCNPFSNSVKDRTAFSMIIDAKEKGCLKKILYEATSTNTGIALTSIANSLGIKTKLFIPQTIQKASDIYLNVLGAEVVRLPVSLTVEAIGSVDSEAKKTNALHLNQFENDANFKVHLKHTAKEIDEQLMSVNLTPTCIIGGLGTSGHMSAISFYFKSKYGDKVKTVGVQPAPNEVIPGLRRIESGMKWCHWTSFDQIIEVTHKEALEGCIKIARKEGLFIGLSSGAVVSAFEKTAEKKGVYVLVFPDTGYKYTEQFEKYLQKS